MVKRYFMESSADKPDDGDYVFFGIRWLVKQPEKALLYVPNADKIENSYLSSLYTKDQGKKFRKICVYNLETKTFMSLLKEQLDLFLI